MNLENLLDKGANELGVELNNNQIEKFIYYLKLLKQWNKKINLTSITDDKEIIIKHFMDSLSVSSLLNINSSLLDIGSGAGFPGLPLAIVNNELPVTLLESTEKKVVFMKEVIRKLELNNAKPVMGRAEDEHNTLKRNSFGFVVTRAIGDIKVGLDLSLPYIIENGKVILMRGKEGVEEWNSFISEFGRYEKYRLVADKIRLTLPFSDYDRVVLAVSK